MTSKLIDRLSILGLEVDASELSQAMKNRPKRNYGGPGNAQRTEALEPTKGNSQSSISEHVPPSSIETKHSNDSSQPTRTGEAIHEYPRTLNVAEPFAATGYHPVTPTQFEDSWATIDDDTSQWPSFPDPSASTETSDEPDLLSTNEPVSSRIARDTIPAKPAGISGYGPVVGQSTDLGQTFCSILAISKLPYKFLYGNKDLGQKISVEFFAEAKFWRKRWTIFYIWPVANEAKPLMLVPIREVERLIDQINERFPTAGLSLTRLRSRHPGFTIQFRSKHARLRPRFLGLSHSQEQYQKLQGNIPSSDYRGPGEPEETRLNLESAEVEEYDTQMFQALDLGGNKKKSSRHATPEAREQYRAEVQRDWKGELEQVERFLGLRPARLNVVDNTSWDSFGKELSWAEVQAQEAAIRALSELGSVNDKCTAPFPFDSDVVFICFDVEAWERDSSKITEIGICTLDTKDLAGIAPAQWGREWYKKIIARHFRIRDHIYLRNGEFVADNSANFRHGQSEIIPLAEAPQTIAKCFRIAAADGTPRKIVLVGHDVRQDIRFLRNMGYDVSNLSNIHESLPFVDTHNLNRAIMRLKDPTPGRVFNPEKLAIVLEKFDITPFGLHNAGNDAVFTMQAMIAMAVESATNRKRAGDKEAVKGKKFDGDVVVFAKNQNPEDVLDDLPAWKKKDDGLDWY